MKKVFIFFVVIISVSRSYSSDLVSKDLEKKMKSVMEVLIDHTLEGDRENSEFVYSDEVDSYGSTHLYLVGIKESIKNVYPNDLLDLIAQDETAKKISEDPFLGKVEEYITHRCLISLSIKKEGECIKGAETTVEGVTAGFSYYISINEILTNEEIKSLPIPICGK